MICTLVQDIQTLIQLLTVFTNHRTIHVRLQINTIHIISTNNHDSTVNLFDVLVHRIHSLHCIFNNDVNSIIDSTKHTRYRYLSDADKKNVFDVERYMKRRPAIVKPDEPFDMYELSAKELTDEPDNNSTKRKET